MANIVNDALATASAAVTPSNKRRHSYAGHTSAATTGRLAINGLQRRRSRFDKDIFELRRPTGLVTRTLSSEPNAATEKSPSMAVGHAGSAPIAGKKKGLCYPSCPHLFVLGWNALEWNGLDCIRIYFYSSTEAACSIV